MKSKILNYFLRNKGRAKILFNTLVAIYNQPIINKPHPDVLELIKIIKYADL